MKKLTLSTLSVCFVVSCPALSQEWKNECVGYYNLQLPNNVEVALYPVAGFINPATRPESNGDIKTSRYASTGITFYKTYIQNRKGTSQAQFTQFYYQDYKLGISSKNDTPIDFTAYRMRRLDSEEFIKNVKKTV